MRFSSSDGDEVEIGSIPTIGCVIDKSIEFLLRAGYSYREIADGYGKSVGWVQDRGRGHPFAGQDDLARPSVADVYHRLDDFDEDQDYRDHSGYIGEKRTKYVPDADVDARHRGVKPNSFYIKQLFRNGYKPKEIAEIMQLSPAAVRDSLKLDGLI